MIADTMDRLENYSAELKDLDKVLAYLKTLDLFSLEKGKYPVPETEGEPEEKPEEKPDIPAPPEKESFFSRLKKLFA